jgi:dephospho-CoA kinase
LPLVIAVTGSIASGKSYLCRYIAEQYGAIHGDADKIMHRLYDPGKPAFDRIVALFGPEVIGTDGYIDRKAIGAGVYGNPERLAAFTGAIGDIPAEMYRTIEVWRQTLTDDQMAIIEAVRLIEPGYSGVCDATWLVGTEYDGALPRLMARNNFTEAEARQRLDAAKAWQDLAPAADHVFLNNGSLDDLHREIDAVVQATLAQYRAGTLPRSRYHQWFEDTKDQRAAELAARAARRGSPSPGPGAAS